MTTLHENKLYYSTKSNARRAALANKDIDPATICLVEEPGRGWTWEPIAQTEQPEADDDPLAIPAHLRREAPTADDVAEAAADEATGDDVGDDAPTADAGDGRERCPHCGRPMPKRRERQPRQREAREPRGPSKESQVLDMLRQGATVAQIAGATGWQRHTVHGFFAGAVKKKLGLNLVSERFEEGDRVYRITE